MPTKKKASAESEAAESAVRAKVTADAGAATEPGDRVAKARRKVPAKTAGKPVAKSPAKKRAGKTAAIIIEEEPGPRVKAAIEAAGSATLHDAETSAHVADTFEDGFEANDPGEAHGAIVAAEAGSEPEKAPDEGPGEGADEGDEAEGDWESGSGDEDKEKRRELPPGKQERLQKILAAAGVASRRHAEQLIVEGRVQVNGQVVTTLGSKADAARDHIRVDGKLLHGAERLRYFMLNKPRGYVTTVSDPGGPADGDGVLRARCGERLYPVGRLDYLSEGLLLMTNDGELANQLTRAASGVEKVYLVKVAGQPGEAQIEALREGVDIERGSAGRGSGADCAGAHPADPPGGKPWFEVGLIEGRNRELRKMFEEIGHHVEKIRRVGYGPLELDVEPGKMRELTPEEVQALRLAAEGKLKPKRIRTSDKLPREAGRAARMEAGKRGGTKPFRSAEGRPETGGGRPGFAPRRGPETRSEPRVESRVEPRPGSRPEWRPAGRPASRPGQRPGQAQDRRELGTEGGQRRGGFKRTGERPQWSGPRAGGGLRAGGGQRPSGGERAGASGTGAGQRAGGSGPRKDAGGRTERFGGRQERGGRFGGERPTSRAPYGERSGTGDRPARSGPPRNGPGRTGAAPARTGPLRGVRRLDLAVEQANSEGPIARWAAEWNALKAGHRAGMRGVQELVR